MKSFLRIFLPASVPFPLLAWLGKILISFNENATELSEVTFSSLKMYLSVAMPLLFLVALVLQALITVQFKNIAHGLRYLARLLLAITGLILLISYAIAYLLWQPELGVLSLLRSVAVLLITQYTYWLISLSVFYLIDLKYNQPMLSLEK